MITLTVNGESYPYEGPLALQAFLERWSAGTRMVAVVNDEVMWDADRHLDGFEHGLPDARPEKIIWMRRNREATVRVNHFANLAGGRAL